LATGCERRPLGGAVKINFIDVVWIFGWVLIAATVSLAVYRVLRSP
jgi:hypothetical protein